jgi:hypothetical protein
MAMALPETWLFGDIMDYFGAGADVVWGWLVRGWIRGSRRKNHQRGAVTYRPEQMINDLAAHGIWPKQPIA